MSLSLTPINEAWQIQKIKKPKLQNSFSNHDNQVKLLKENNHEIHPKNMIPSGSNLSDKNYKQLAPSTDIVQPLAKQSEKQSLTIEFDNPIVLRYLNKYKESFAKELVEGIIVNSIEEKSQHTVETFTDGKNVDNTIIIIILAVILLYSLASD